MPNSDSKREPPSGRPDGGRSGKSSRSGADRNARRRELFGAVTDLPRPDLIAWLRQYVRRHPFPHTLRLREARRWLAVLEGERSGGDGGAA